MKEKFEELEEIFRKHNFTDPVCVNLVLYYVLEKGTEGLSEVTDDEIADMYNHLVEENKAREQKSKETGKILISLMTPEFQKTLVTCAVEIVRSTKSDSGVLMGFIMSYVSVQGLRKAEFGYSNPERYKIYRHKNNGKHDTFDVKDVEADIYIAEDFKSKEAAENYVDELTNMTEEQAWHYVSHKEDERCHSFWEDELSYMDEERPMNGYER